MGADGEPPQNAFVNFISTMSKLVEGPVVWFRESIVVPNRQEYNWYHQRYRRVPTVDQCYKDDPICKFEANQQFKRDKAVDNEILNILRMRFQDCITYEAPDYVEKCTYLKEQYDEATTNWFIKYGDLGGYGTAEKALTKQKHRLIWERRHGPVGSGMKTKDEI